MLEVLLYFSVGQSFAIMDFIHFYFLYRENHQIQMVSRWSNAQMELHGYFPLVHDRVSRPVWRVDREHVGLHVRWRLIVRALLPGHRSHRQLGCEYPAQ